MIDLQSPAMAVIIGAWREHQQQIIEHCLHNIIDFVDSVPAFEVTVLGGNHVTVSLDTQGKNSWYSNSRRIFVEEQGVDWVRRLWGKNEIGTVSWYEPIRDYEWQTDCISVWEQWQLEYLLNHVYPNIQNVWYFGIGLGVRRDPIGWGHLSDSIRCNHVRDVNILTKQDCLLHNTMDDPDFVKTTFTNPDFSGTDWCLVKGDVYAKTTRNWNPETPNGF